MHATMIEINLHGGLGNQLFQIYAAKILASGTHKIVLNTYFLSKYLTKTKLELFDLFHYDFFADISVVHGRPKHCIASARLVKIASKLLQRDICLGLPSGRFFMDSYYQDPQFYSAFDPKIRFEVLHEMRACARQRLSARALKTPLIHLRLGDFFPSHQKKQEYIASFAAQLQLHGNFHLITNEEHIARQWLGKSLADRFYIVPTSGFDASSVLALMSSYSEIYTNGSSIAMWSALLAGHLGFTSTSLVHKQFFDSESFNYKAFLSD